jgi:hypothetical protein
MNSTNSRTEVIADSHTVSHTEGVVEATAVELPDDYKQLAAVKAAAESKMVEMQTTRAEALRNKWHDEAAALGLTADEVLRGPAAKKPRRAKRQKRDE